MFDYAFWIGLLLPLIFTIITYSFIEKKIVKLNNLKFDILKNKNSLNFIQKKEKIDKLKKYLKCDYYQFNDEKGSISFFRNNEYFRSIFLSDCNNKLNEYKQICCDKDKK